MIIPSFVLGALKKVCDTGEVDMSSYREVVSYLRFFSWKTVDWICTNSGCWKHILKEMKDWENQDWY